MPQIWDYRANGTLRSWAHLHADDRVDEEQHGYEEGDIRERLEERKHPAQRWPLVPVLLGTD